MDRSGSRYNDGSPGVVGPGPGGGGLPTNEEELSLIAVLKCYEQPINEEQAWAVCFQCCRGLLQQPMGGGVLLRDPESLLLHKDGSVTVCREARSNVNTAGPSRKHVPPTFTEAQIVQSLGFTIYRALDWGLDENEERELSPELETLIDMMANGDSKDSNGIADEGYEGQEDEEDEADGPPRTVKTFQQVMRACAFRLTNPSEAQSHYQAVCRALFLETLELKTFLEKIHDAKEMLKKMGEHDESLETSAMELDDLRHTDWARLWVQLMRDLRHGVKLKKVQEKQYNPLATEYQLTPFEMLMQDIRARNYTLRKVMQVDGSIPPRVKKDAHELILEFIRSRPPLKPVSERNLRPLPVVQQTLHERILAEIKQERKLRPVEKEYGSLPCLLTACSKDPKSSSCMNLSVPDTNTKGQRQHHRVLLKAPTLAEMEEMNISEEEDSPDGDIRRVLSSPVPLKRDRSFSERDLAQLQTEMAVSQSESTYFKPREPTLRPRSGSTVSAPGSRVTGQSSAPASRTTVHGSTSRSTAHGYASGSRSTVHGSALGSRSTGQSSAPGSRSTSQSSVSRSRPTSQISVTRSRSTAQGSAQRSRSTVQGSSIYNRQTSYRPRPFSPDRVSLSSVDEKSETDSVSVSSSKYRWLEEFSHPVESLALTIEEVINIRKVLVKGELEKFLQNKELYSNLKKGKVCCCCRVKFPLFSWPSSCFFCKRSVCNSCHMKMKVPSKSPGHIPVYTVGFESSQGTAFTGASHSRRNEPYQSLSSVTSQPVEQEFPYIYANGYSLKDVCTECTKFVADVISSSRKSLDFLNGHPRKGRKTQSLYVNRPASYR
ncbi:protein spire homolog 2 isoform X2 [Protopterus annectens]|uniref:protein spire homolog 2 isoform X2 n=1 Tax=Protopterus annectens TaxID=7888 RepID=UPI001CF95227|nr:protein spire homolog 2 isoform X2 [Protopterus annectens]